MDVTLLSRIQFAMTIAFHYIYPPLSIGLGVVLVVMEGLYLKTRLPVYQQMTRFWVRVFGLTFALGVATGIVMEFEFGTNWAAYSRFVGDVFGTALAAEGIFAFFLEIGLPRAAAVRLGQGRPADALLRHADGVPGRPFQRHLDRRGQLVDADARRLPPGRARPRHAGGGHRLLGDGLQPVDRRAADAHGARRVAGRRVPGHLGERLLPAEGEARGLRAPARWRSGVALALVASLGSLATGHASAVGVSRNQPAKLAAMEAHFPASAPADLYVFGWVDEAKERVYGMAMPGMLSWMLHGDATTPVTGLLAFPPEDRPPVQPGVPGLPPDGRHRHGPDRALAGGGLLAVRRGASPPRVAAVAVRRRGARAADREPGGLDDGGGRAPAVDRLRPDAHQRGRQPLGLGRGRRLLAGPVHADLHAALRAVPLPARPEDQARPAGGRPGRERTSEPDPWTSTSTRSGSCWWARC